MVLIAFNINEQWFYKNLEAMTKATNANSPNRLLRQWPQQKSNLSSLGG